MALGPYLHSAASQVRNAAADAQQQARQMQVQAADAQRQLKRDIDSAQMEKLRLRGEEAITTDGSMRNSLRDKVHELDQRINTMQHKIQQIDADTKAKVNGKLSQANGLESQASSLDNMAGAAD